MGATPRPRSSITKIYASVIDLPAKASVLQLIEHQPGDGKMTPDVAMENETVKRMKDHRLQVAGKTYQLPARRVSSPYGNFLDGAPDVIAGGHVPLRHRCGPDGLDRQRRFTTTARGANTRGG